jgi:hypothetical protein
VLASGDKDPYDNKSTGYDAIMENPQIAGSDTSFSIRQGLPLIGGGGVALSGRNGILPSLRSSKDEGQSNFVNPGLMLLGVGADLDVAPNCACSAMSRICASWTRACWKCCVRSRFRRKRWASISRSARTGGRSITRT